MIAFDHVYSICVSSPYVFVFSAWLGLSQSSCQGCAHNITRKPSEMDPELPELPELMRASSSSAAANLSYSAPACSRNGQTSLYFILFYIILYYFMYMGVVRKTFSIGVTSADMDLCFCSRGVRPRTRKHDHNSLSRFCWGAKGPESAAFGQFWGTIILSNPHI